MGHEKNLAKGARVFGAVLLSVLALLNLAWIARDFREATEVTDVWWLWAGLAPRAADGVWVSSFVEPTLLVLYTIAAVTVARSSAAGGLLISTGVLTIALRLPGLWNLNANWRQGIESDLKNLALCSTVAMVVLGGALLVTAVAGRRPLGAGTFGPPHAARPQAPADEPPAQPTQGGSAVGLLLLTAAGAVTAAWQVYYWQQHGWDNYSNSLTGERTVITLLETPTGWREWAVTLLTLAAAAICLSRAPLARPFGMTAAAALLGTGIFSASRNWKLDTFEGFADLTTEAQLAVATGVFLLVVGLGTLLALAPRGVTGRPPEAANGPGSAGGYGRADHGHPPHGEWGYGPSAAETPGYGRPGYGAGGEHGAAPGGGYGAGYGAGSVRPPAH